MSLNPIAPEELVTFRRAMGGLSQRALAEELGISTRAVEEWEAGRKPAPLMARLAMAALNAQLPPWSSVIVYQIVERPGGWDIRVAGRSMGSWPTREEAAEKAKTFAKGLAAMGSCCRVEVVDSLANRVSLVFENGPATI